MAACYYRVAKTPPMFFDQPRASPRVRRGAVRHASGSRAPTSGVLESVQRRQEMLSMTQIVIYGDAVQDARNRLRSAQISTMVDILRNALFKDASDERATHFARRLRRLIDPPLLAGLLAQ
jgi:hypothetical protein